jgi:hypothetical protein
LPWTDQIFELIGLRSFSSIWFWFVLAGLWSLATHSVLSVPHDIIAKANKSETTMAHFQTLTDLAVARRLTAMSEGGAILIGVGCFCLTVLALLGFGYGLELAQAVFLLVAPLVLVWVLGVLLARKITSQALLGQARQKVMLRHRRLKQLIATLAIFVTAMWGMYQNMVHSVLGG